MGQGSKKGEDSPDHGEGSGDLDGANRVFHLGKGVEGIRVADECPNDVVQTRDEGVGVRSAAGEGVDEVGRARRSSVRDVTTEGTAGRLSVR